MTLLLLALYLLAEMPMQTETTPSSTVSETVEPASGGCQTERSTVVITNATTVKAVMSQSEVIWNALYKEIPNSIAVAAIMGNMQEESRMCAYRWQGYTVEQSRQMMTNRKSSAEAFICDGLGFGLCQWTDWGRKNKLWSFAEDKGFPIDDAIMQCEFCAYEFNTRYVRTLDHITNTDDLDYATEIVRNEYEKAVKDPISLYRRQKYAKEFYELYGE